MILALRKRHRHVIAGLAVLLPITVVMGIAARRTMSGDDSLPPALSAGAQIFTATGVEQGDLFPKSAIRVQLWRDQPTGRLALGFTAPPDFLKPDLLVYWFAGRREPSRPLLENATLLGAFVAGPLALPPEAATSEGSLILFSLADQEIVAVSQPTLFNDKTR